MKPHLVMLQHNEVPLQEASRSDRCPHRADIEPVCELSAVWLSGGCCSSCATRYVDTTSKADGQPGVDGAFHSRGSICLQRGGGSLTTSHRGRHALDPNLIPCDTPGPSRRPDLKLVKCVRQHILHGIGAAACGVGDEWYACSLCFIRQRVKGCGFGSCTSGRGLVSSPIEQAQQRRLQREQRTAARRKRDFPVNSGFKRAPISPLRAPAEGARRRPGTHANSADSAGVDYVPSERLLRPSTSSSPCQAKPMISTAKRSSPLMWHETRSHTHAKAARSSTPGPAHYGPSRNTDQRAMLSRGGRFTW